MLENLELKNKLIHHRGLRQDQLKPNSLDGVYYEKNTHLECDVFFLSDGELVVVHNKDLDVSMEEVESWNKEICQEKNIPLLKEFILANLEQKNKVVIEHKASSPEKAKQTIENTILLIKQLREDGYFHDYPEYPNKCLSLHSFSIEALEHSTKIMDQTGEYLNLEVVWLSAPERALDMAISKTIYDHIGYQEGWTNDQWIKAGIKMARKLNCFSIHIFENIITKELVDLAHAQGLKVYTVLVNDPSKYESFLDLGVDKILTEV